MLAGCAFASEPGSAEAANEDYALAAGNFFVVLDGLTSRTESGCVHGTPWFVRQLASFAVSAANETVSLREILARAIKATAKLHADTCDLHSLGTPAAAVGMMLVEPLRMQYLILGDVTLAARTRNSASLVAVDGRINQSARALRERANTLSIGSREKAELLVEMKRAELTERNRTGGYWVAAATPEAAEHATTGSIDYASFEAAALFTDGAARLVTPFSTHSWQQAFELLDHGGPSSLINTVRSYESSDPLGSRWPRNKTSDDATVLLIQTRSDSIELR